MYIELKKSFALLFGENKEIRVYSAPGRVELGGNHTDHQNGCVLAAAVSLDMKAAVAPNGSNVIRVKSEGYDIIELSLDDLEPVEADKNTTKALVRGVADGMVKRGGKPFGIDMYIISDVLKGSGLSSSAAFEVLLGTAMSDMFGCEMSAVEIAQNGQYAEIVHFGKPSGLMDQMASSVGGVVAIDFSLNPPKIEKLECNLVEYGYDLVIIDAGADHADLTDEYAAIPSEMKSVAKIFGKELLREVDEKEFYDRIAEVRKAVGDRAVLRAVHFYNDSRRAVLEAECLKNKDFDGFLKLVTESGKSSFMYLQNIYVSGEIKNQAMAYALAVCENALAGEGAVRIQGGGFGGTLEAFVPKYKTSEFAKNVEAAIGKDACKVISLRTSGGVRLG